MNLKKMAFCDMDNNSIFWTSPHGALSSFTYMKVSDDMCKDLGSGQRFPIHMPKIMMVFAAEKMAPAQAGFTVPAANVPVAPPVSNSAAASASQPGSPLAAAGASNATTSFRHIKNGESFVIEDPARFTSTKPARLVSVDGAGNVTLIEDHVSGRIYVSGSYANKELVKVSEHVAACDGAYLFVSGRFRVRRIHVAPAAAAKAAPKQAPKMNVLSKPSDLITAAQAAALTMRQLRTVLTWPSKYSLKNWSTTAGNYLFSKKEVEEIRKDNDVKVALYKRASADGTGSQHAMPIVIGVPVAAAPAAQKVAAPAAQPATPLSPPANEIPNHIKLSALNNNSVRHKKVGTAAMLVLDFGLSAGEFVLSPVTALRLSNMLNKAAADSLASLKG